MGAKFEKSELCMLVAQQPNEPVQNGGHRWIQRIRKVNIHSRQLG